MADTRLLFDMFGDTTTQRSAKKVLRQPLSNENMGKAVLQGPVKPNEPTKKTGKLTDMKKSFLSNAGKAFQSTPARQVFSPKIAKASPMIYTEEKDEGIDLEEIEFTKPPQRLDAYNDMFGSVFKFVKQTPAPRTPPPQIRLYSMELAFDCDELSDLSIDSLSDEDLGLPDLY